MGESPAELQQLTLPVWDNDECEERGINYALNITDNMICAGYMEEGKSSCHVSWTSVCLWSDVLPQSELQFPVCLLDAEHMCMSKCNSFRNGPLVLLTELSFGSFAGRFRRPPGETR